MFLYLQCGSIVIYVYFIYNGDSKEILLGRGILKIYMIK